MTEPVTVCDHTSVGMMIWRNDRLLLIERKKFPFGIACPAGQVDDHGSYEKAAAAELSEEVGLVTEELKLLLEEDKNNQCRRKEGSWHHWKVFDVRASGEVRVSTSETKRYFWADKVLLEKLAQRTEKYLQGAIDEEEWEQSPGLEVVWYEFLKQLEII